MQMSSSNRRCFAKQQMEKSVYGVDPYGCDDFLDGTDSCSWAEIFRECTGHLDRPQ